MNGATHNGQTVVLQSQHDAALLGWQGRCSSSVERWSQRQDFRYRRQGDELFERIDPELRRRFADQPVVLSDLARLLWLREVLEEGFERAIWIDADVLVFRDFVLPETGDRFGRECWVQPDGTRLRSYRKLHNAWLQFSTGSAVLPYYIDRAQTLLSMAEAPVVPQFIGPKLLTAWHNIVPFNIEERVGMLPPLAMAELLAEPSARSPALRLLCVDHAAPLCALNLCASYENRSVDGVLHVGDDFHALIDVLQQSNTAALLDSLGARP
ncbi:MAG: hypothetical protein AAGA95_06555 [Pseudomonadota bacterium]